MRSLRHLLAVAVLALTGAGAAALAPQSGAWASCAGPRVTLTPTTATPGSDVDVTGQWFLTDCYDTGQQGTPPARKGLTVTLTEGGRTERLTTIDAASDGSVAVRVRLPSDLVPGAASLTVDGALPVPLAIVAGQPIARTAPLPTPAPRAGTTDGTAGGTLADALDRGPWPWVVLGAVGAAVLVALRAGRRRAPTAAPRSGR